MADEPPLTLSEPPAVRLINARGMAWQIVISQLAELLFIGCATYLCAAGKISAEIWVGACGWSTTGGLVGKIRAKTPFPMTWILMFGAPALALRHLAIMGLALALVFAPLQGCAAVFAALPTIIAAASTASDVITEIEHFVSQREHDHAIDVAITKARAALAAVREAAAGAQSVHDGDLQAALTSFQQAYQDVLDLVGPLGVHAPPEAGRLAAPGPNELLVPSAPVLRLSLEGRS